MSTSASLLLLTLVVAVPVALLALDRQHGCHDMLVCPSTTGRCVYPLISLFGANVLGWMYSACPPPVSAGRLFTNGCYL